jgi:hypothetical protein
MDHHSMRQGLEVEVGRFSPFTFQDSKDCEGRVKIDRQKDQSEKPNSKSKSFDSFPSLCIITPAPQIYTQFPQGSSSFLRMIHLQP